ncbi:MAG: acylphosphatase [Thermoanaerobaculaceae bacterium]
MPEAGVSADRQAQVRVRAVCTGVVQGVGFRPAVFRHARGHGVAGFVANSPQGAVIEVEGKAEDVKGFFRSLPQALPPLARLESVQLTEVPPKGEKAFLVADSQEGPGRERWFPPIPRCARIASGSWKTP